MYKSRYFETLLCCLPTSLIPLSFMTVSCQRQEDDPHIDWNPLIVFTDNQVCHTNLDPINHSCTARFDDFHYIDLPSLNKVSVRQDYSYGYARFNSYIGNLDQKNQTFSVFVQVSYINECTVSSPFTFYYEDNPLPIQATQNNFTIYIESKSAVLYEGVVHKESKINTDDTISFTFSNFKIINIPDFDPSKLKVSHTFAQQQPGSSVETKINPTSTKDVVDLELNFTNVYAGVIESDLTFTYDNIPLEQQLPYSFQLTLIAKPTIYIPTTPVLNCIVNPDSCELIISGFSFVSVSEEDKDKITVENNFVLESGQITTTIVNWNQINQTFEIKLSCENVQTLPKDLISGNLFFKLDGESIADSTYEFHLNFIRPIPNTHINYSYDSLEMVKTDGHLNDIQNETNSLIVPSFVQKIGNSFIDNADISFFTERPHQLLFENGSMLKIIGESAFSATFFSNDIELPISLKTIGNQAFYNSPSTKMINFKNAVSLVEIGNSAFESSQFSGDVFIHKNIETVGSSAFALSSFDGCLTIESATTNIGQGCFANMPNIKEIDLSTFTAVPFWMKDPEAKIFENIGSGVLSPASKGTVWINPFVPQEEIQQALISSCLLPENLWNIVVKE